jgi:hypothetical protein
MQVDSQSGNSAMGYARLNPIFSEERNARMGLWASIVALSFVTSLHRNRV